MKKEQEATIVALLEMLEEEKKNAAKRSQAREERLREESREAFKRRPNCCID
jgi:hypothetical protein